MLTRDAFARFAPRPSKPALAKVWDDYVEALFSKETAAALVEHEITTRRRIWHFLAQCAHECMGFSRIWENMKYSPQRIVEVFGVGKHSARVSRAEAQALAGNEEALAERVYGISNPKMAKMLGNREPGDGYRYRGFGIKQITGRHNHQVYLSGEHTPQAAVLAAIKFWSEKGCNEFADRDDIEGLTRRINGGLNGLTDRKRYLAKAIAVWPTDKDVEISRAGIGTLKMGDEGEPVLRLQELLLSKNYFVGRVDGIYAERTRDAVAMFQLAHGLKVDGEYGELTRKALEVAPPREERKGVTGETMAEQGDPGASVTTRIKSVLKWLGGFFGVATSAEASFGLVSTCVDKAGEVKEVLDKALGIIGGLPRGVVLITVAGAVFLGLLYWWADRKEKAIVAKARKGGTL